MGYTESQSTESLTGYAWNEVAKHNSVNDCWISVRDKVYDITQWIPKHPGGADLLLLNAGRDCTVLFESYHPLNTQLILDKFCIGNLTTYEFTQYPPMSMFYKTVKQRVENYFKQTNQDPRPAKPTIILTIIFILSIFTFHSLSIYCAYNSKFLLALLIQVIVGIFSAWIDMFTIHESSHSTAGHSPLLTRILGSTMDYINGISFYCWLHQHFLGHHVYTGIEEFDPDLTANNEYDVRRIKTCQKWRFYYYFQHIYFVFIYSQLCNKFRFEDVQILFFTKRDGVIRVNPADKLHIFNFFAGKLFFLLYRYIIPGYFIGYINAIILAQVADIITSTYLANIFQVNHVVDELPSVKATDVVDWAEQQVNTTLDYGHHSPLSAFLSGGLNYQVVHHIFPNVSQFHYSKIAPLVKKTCEEFGITYHYKNNFLDAWFSHVRFLQKMGDSAPVEAAKKQN